MLTLEIKVLSPNTFQGVLVEKIGEPSGSNRLFIRRSLLTANQINLLDAAGEQDEFIIACQVQGKNCIKISSLKKKDARPQPIEA